MKDIHNTNLVVSLADPAIVAATTTLADDVDLAGFNAAELVISLGANTGTTPSSSHKLVFALWHADDDGTGSAGAYALVEPKDVLGVTATDGVLLTTDAAAKYETTYQFGYVGGKRFLRLIATETGTVSVTMGVSLVKGHPLDAPV